MRVYVIVYYMRLYHYGISVYYEGVCDSLLYEGIKRLLCLARVYHYVTPEFSDSFIVHFSARFRALHWWTGRALVNPVVVGGVGSQVPGGFYLSPKGDTSQGPPDQRSLASGEERLFAGLFTCRRYYI